MEKMIASELKISALKQDTLCKAYETLHSEASSVLLFALQWKDLEEHLNSTRKSLQDELDEFVEREAKVEAREKQLEAKESELKMEIELKAENLDVIEKQIEERSHSLESSIQGKRQELEIMVSQYHATQKLVAEKEREIDQLVKGIRERTKKLDSLERSVRQRSEEAELASRELESIRGVLKKCRDDLDAKERQFRSIRRSVEDHKKEVEEKEEKLRLMRNLVLECDKEIKLREEKLGSIQYSIFESSIELELMEKKLDLVRMDEEVKQKNFASLKKLVDECVHEFGMKERQFESLVEKLGVKETSFELKIEELGLINKKVNERFEEVESKERSVVSIQRLVEERFCELEKRENELEERVNEFTLRQKEFDSIQKPTGQGLGVKEKIDIIPSRVKLEQPDNNLNSDNFLSFASYQYSITNGQFLQMLLSEQLRRHDFRCTELFAVLQISPDPPKLVLDAVQGFYPLHSSRKETEFDLSIVRRSCILLLEQLMKASPDIRPQLREEAMKLASDWKAKMTVTTANFLEVLGFLHLVASYGLASAFDADEVRSLVDVVGQNREASELRRALCIAEEARVNIDRPEYSRADTVTSSPNFQSSSTTSEGSSERIIHERIIQEDLTGKDLTQNDITVALQMPDPAKHVLDIIEGSFSQRWKKGDVGFEASVMTSYISMFEQLLRISPGTDLNVREDAMRLAGEWKEKMRANTENPLEVLGFLQFLAIYGLVSSFNEDEILRYLEMISQNKHALELSRPLASAYKIPVFIRNLIRRKKVIEAVRLTYAFELTEKFSPIKLLTDHMDYAKSYFRQLCEKKKSIEEKDEATDKEIASLRSVLECIKDYSLESQLPSDNISKRIALLEKIKNDRRHSALFFRSIDEQQQQQTSNKRRKSTMVSGEQPQKQSKKKCARTTLSNPKPCDTPISKIVL